jgi:hypothetical protein
LLSSANFWCCAAESVLSDIAADLVGPDIKFHSGKLNLHPCLTDDASCGLAIGNLVGNFDPREYSTLNPLTVGIASATASCR